MQALGIGASTEVRGLDRSEAAGRKEEALWLLERLAPRSAPNNLSVAFRVDGRLQELPLQEALTLLVRRHEVLRHVYRASGAHLTRSVLDPSAVRLVPRVLTTRPEDLDADLTAFVAERFPLDGSLLLRAAVLRGAGGDVFCLAVHHLVFDTLSGVSFLSELAEVYGALADTGAPPPALLEAVPALAEPEPAEDSLEFWRKQLADYDLGALDLWCGVPDTAEPTLVGDRVLHDLSEAARAAVKRLQRELRAPETAVLLAAYQLLLAAHGAGPDLAVGSPVDVRPREAAGAIGYHVNVLPLRARVTPEQTVRTFVRSTRDVFFDALAHADVPVDHLTPLVPRGGSSWRNMLFRHLFNYVPDSVLHQFTIGGRQAEPLVVENGFSKFDLEFFVVAAPDRLRVRAVYCTELLTRQDVELLLERYDALLVQLAEDVERSVGALRVWGDQDHEVIATANRTQAEVGPESVLTAFTARLLASPDAPAVHAADGATSYRQLWHAALTVRERLTEAEVRHGDVVAVAAQRGPELAAAALGSWLAGAAYLPLDPEHPEQRIAYQLSDSGARAVLAGPGVHLPGAGDRTVLTLARAGDAPARPLPTEPVATDPVAPAYLIYTSGSTGRPKGTVVGHRALANLVAHFGTELDAGPDTTAVWLTTFSFDISGLELYVPLAHGGSVVAAPDAARTDGGVLRELIERHDADVVQATPTTWRLVLEAAGPALRGRRVLCGGEAAPQPLVERLLATGSTLHHVYGPTETTIWSTSAILRPGDPEPAGIGRPIANTRVLVLAPDGTELPIGVRGELCIGGDGVAHGYHGRPELTAERFVDDPERGRYYRTGDLARWRANGTLELLGRADRQIKLRGNRIEPGEIEAVMLAHPSIRGAAVALVGDPDADAALVAFVEPVGADSAGVTGDLVERLWEHVRAELPRALVPQELLVLDVLPTTPNDKVDYPALTELARARRAEATSQGSVDYTGDPLVRDLIGLWQRVLNRQDITADTNFFSHGGHSLLGALVVQEAEALLGVRVALSELFQHPTPSRLAGRLRAAGGDQTEGRRESE
ncbi:amino acid adenylation domain-containing protein [Streptomyces sp. NPDC052043]|uniref:amino acid adenylation domain-containing protein n=1 Tax=Streptomyces sp. NPDC052043 TaxID=3365684 RepID=UPI0037D88936